MNNITKEQKSSVSNDHYYWQWKDGLVPWDQNVEKWVNYPSDLNEKIEQHFLKNIDKVDIGEFTIDLKAYWQIRNAEPMKFRQVQRVKLVKEIQKSNIPRANRFDIMTSSILTFSKPCVDDIHSLPSIIDDSQYQEIESLDLKGQLQMAIQGIFQAGNLVRSKYYGIYDTFADSTSLNKILMDYIYEEKEKVYPKIITMYTKETFLYRELNSALRVSDKNLGCLGIFSVLLNSSIQYFKSDSNSIFQETLYRGCELSKEQRDQYYDALKGNSKLTLAYKGFNFFTWHGFSSATKSKKLADSFGNTLFHITYRNLDENHYPTTLDISEFSDFPQEEEILTCQRTQFAVERIIEEKDKTHIYLIGSVVIHF